MPVILYCDIVSFSAANHISCHIHHFAAAPERAEIHPVKQGSDKNTVPFGDIGSRPVVSSAAVPALRFKHDAPRFLNREAVKKQEKPAAVFAFRCIHPCISLHYLYGQPGILCGIQQCSIRSAEN